MTAAQYQFQLKPFLDSDHRNFPSIDVEIDTVNRFLVIEFLVQDNTPATIDWPKQQTLSSISDKQSDSAMFEQLRKDELWKHTCFELFSAAPGHTSYREFNFSSAGTWNCYEFNDYRQGMQTATINHIPTSYRSGNNSHQHRVVIKLHTDELVIDEQQHTQLSITAVIQHQDSSYDYYALKHCGSQPDFHLRDSFSLDLDTSNQEK